MIRDIDFNTQGTPRCKHDYMHPTNISISAKIEGRAAYEAAISRSSYARVCRDGPSLTTSQTASL